MTTRLTSLTLFVLTVLPGATADPAVQKLSRDILKELIEINTTDTPRGNVTAADMFLAGPNDRKKDLVISLHGTSSAQKPLKTGLPTLFSSWKKTATSMAAAPRT
jgi:poly(3-hydroxybutyrate) depolymerase